MNIQQLLGYLTDNKEKTELMELYSKARSSNPKQIPLTDLRHSLNDEPDSSVKQSLPYYKTLLKSQNATIKNSQQTIQEQRKKIADLKKETFWMYGVSKKDRKAKKAKKREIKSAKASLKSSKQALQDAIRKRNNIQHTISKIKDESKKAKQTLASYEKSILGQVQTQKLLAQISSILPKIPNLSDPKYADMISLHNQYAKKAISIHDPLPQPNEIPSSIRNIVTLELGKQVAEKGLQTIRGVVHTVQTLTGNKTDLQKTLKKWATKSANTRPTFFKEVADFLKDTGSPLAEILLPIIFQTQQRALPRPNIQPRQALPASGPTIPTPMFPSFPSYDNER